jgi:hypothetical protein
MRGRLCFAPIYGALTVSSDRNVNCDIVTCDLKHLTSDNDSTSLTVDKPASAQQHVCVMAWRGVNFTFGFHNLVSSRGTNSYFYSGHYANTNVGGQPFTTVKTTNENCDTKALGDFFRFYFSLTGD